MVINRAVGGTIDRMSRERRGSPPPIEYRRRRSSHAGKLIDVAQTLTP
jgi:hypothetical protein